MSGRVEGKVAFITGAARGQGRSHAVRLAREGAGIIAVDICRHIEGVPFPMPTPEDLDETVSLVEKEGGRIIATQADVRDEEALKAAVDEGVARLGRLDIVVANAGIGSVGSPLESMPAAVWQDMLDINLTGVWHCLRHEIPAMLQSGGGAIVNCASTAGIRGAATCGAYSASKHGVVGLTRSAALEYASQGIRINAVCPGMIETPMTQKPGMGELIAQLVEVSPLRRMGQPEEIGAAVFWLCSDDASFVHGQAIPVDGAITSR